MTAFVAAAIDRGSVAVSLATNLLAGLIVVTFIDSLLRSAEERRIRPLRIAALEANASVAHRMGELIGDATVSVNLPAKQKADQIRELKTGRISNFLSLLLEKLILFDGSKNGPYLSYSRQAKMIAESVDQALETFGFAQDPEMVLLLARIRSLSILKALRRPSRAKRGELHITQHDWGELIGSCNRLSTALERAAARCPGFYFTPPSKRIAQRLAPETRSFEQTVPEWIASRRYSP